MDKVKRQIDRAQRRLFVQQLVGVLPWCLFVTLLFGAVAIGVPKFFALPFDPTVWIGSWMAGAVAAGLLAAAIWTYARRGSSLQAAIEIDRRFGLKERVSSMISLRQDERESAVGQALVNDAMRQVSGLDVGERFGVSLGRKAWLPLLPAAMAFSLAMFVADKGLENPAEAMTRAAAKKRVKTSTEVLHRKLVQRRKQAEEKGLKEAQGLFNKLEEGIRRLNEKKDVDPKKAMVKLNDLARELEKRRQAIGSSEQIRKQFGGLKDIRKGPADRLAKAMCEGDFQKALHELKKLQDQIRSGKLDEETKKKLAEQMRQMKEKLQQAADKHQQAMNDLKEMLKDARHAGQSDQADKLQQQLDRLAQKMPQMDQMNDIANKLADASRQMQQGKLQDATESLDQVAQNLDQMQRELDELEMLDETLDGFVQAKDAMGCKQCGGTGCKACNGRGQAQGQGQGQRRGKGDGLGPGQGRGARPEEKDQTGSYDSQVRQNVGKGKAVITDLVPGRNIKGRVSEDIKSEIEAARRESADPLVGQRLPRPHREHAREYFNRFRDGE